MLSPTSYLPRDCRTWRGRKASFSPTSFPNRRHPLIQFPVAVTMPSFANLLIYFSPSYTGPRPAAAAEPPVAPAENPAATDPSGEAGIRLRETKTSRRRRRRPRKTAAGLARTAAAAAATATTSGAPPPGATAATAANTAGTASTTPAPGTGPPPPPGQGPAAEGEPRRDRGRTARPTLSTPARR